MSQFAMQMPGSQLVSRRPSLNVYTGLMFVAVVCLGAACAMLWKAGSSVSPKQGPTAPFSLQDPRSIQLPR